MRKIVLCVLAGVLMAVVTARALLPESARAAVADGQVYGYNIGGASLPITRETAGSALLAELNGYFLFRTPTAKNELTGLFAGKDLILIYAENWRVPDLPGRYSDPALYRLDRGGARLADVYRTDWYQGVPGQLFALLTGVVPTTVDEKDALTWTGEQDIWFPYTLPRLLSAEGCRSTAWIRDGLPREAFRILGFDDVTVLSGTAEEAFSENLSDLMDAGRYFAFFYLPDRDCADALETLLDGLREARRLDRTVICLAAGAGADDRARIFLYGTGIQGAVSRRPCSALDVTPTLLNLLGLPYDSRFLSGLDVFSTNSETGVVRAVTPVVSLYGSAYSDWVTDAGSYSSEGRIFRQTADCFADSADVSAYVHDVTRLVYDRYVYTRRAMECNYFRAVLPAG